MGKTIHRAGVVVSGDYSGKSIYMRNDYSFMIISNDENGKCKFSERIGKTVKSR